MGQNKKKRAVAVLVFLIIVAAGLLVILYLIELEKETHVVPDAEKIVSVETNETAFENKIVSEVKLPSEPTVTKPSDESIRKLAGALSGDADYYRWLQTSYLLSKFVAVVENISTGQSPRTLLTFLEPKGSFTVINRGEIQYLDPESYHRYDRFIESFSSIDAGQCALLYNKLQPWLDQKYREIGSPDQNFENALAKAIAELLRVPVVETNILLKRKAVSYLLASEELEALSDAQKHLFRMGPDNIRKAQSKLREIARTLSLENFNN